MFTVSKRTAGDVPDAIELDVAYASVVKGVAVQIDGSLADAAGDSPAGICVSDYAGPTGSTSGANFSPNYPEGPDGSGNVKALVIPVDRQTLIEADVIGTKTADIVVGYETSIAVGGLGVLPTINLANNDFRVVEIVNVDGDGYATKVRGFFVTPGYYV